MMGDCDYAVKAATLYDAQRYVFIPVDMMKDKESAKAAIGFLPSQPVYAKGEKLMPPPY